VELLNKIVVLPLHARKKRDGWVPLSIVNKEFQWKVAPSQSDYTRCVIITSIILKILRVEKDDLTEKLYCDKTTEIPLLIFI
jgi:hypothetical protein